MVKYTRPDGSVETLSEFKLDEVNMAKWTVDDTGNLVDRVNSPPHYGQGNIECIEYIEDFLNQDEFIGYLRGNIAKYMHRFRYKNGVEDLKKAQWYLNRLIKEMESV
jgi:hypothetical protein